ncbi:MAG: T9SS type A sorting domain-containing protein [Calditrichaceae bacterium]|nr:T9SS type A sorting domain-containing protein [Calditrichaceae bacterium]
MLVRLSVNIMKRVKIKIKLFTLIGVIMSTSNVSAQDSDFYIFLCFGQSNMEGQGTIETRDKTVDNRFQVFQALNCSNLGRTKANWYKAVPPLCQCWSGLSPADYFGRTMVANLPDSIKVGVINVSIGGCDIRLFDKDIYQDYDSTYTESWFTDKVRDYEWNPYQYLIDLAQSAQQDGVIKGILLHQGETNTGDTKWPSYVKKIYNDMLNDLSLEADSVPLLAGELVSAEGNCCASMNAIINTLPDTIPTAHVISSSGCTAKDNAHFDSEGYRELGKRYGEKMLTLLGYDPTNMENSMDAADSFVLKQNYPNPFNPNTTIEYTLSDRSNVVLRIFDMNGKLIKMLIYETQNAGNYKVIWDGKSDLNKKVSTGTYMYELSIDGEKIVKQMIFLK